MKKRHIVSLIAASTVIFAFAAGAGAETVEEGPLSFETEYEAIVGCDYSASGRIVIPAEIGGVPVTTIGKHAFNGCDGVTDIVIPDSVMYIGSDAFDGTAYFDDDDNWEGGVLYIGKYLIRADMDITDCAVKNGTRVIADGAFSECADLEKITIPNGVSSIGSAAFSGCDSLENIAIPDGVTYIGDYAFEGCASLTGIKLPKGIKNIDWGTFAECYSLEEIVIPDGAESIGEEAFLECGSLKSVVIPETVNNIGAQAFEDCAELQEVIIPNGVRRIEERTFANCENLKSVTIPNSVSSIYEGAFDGCASLTDIFYGGTEEEWENVRISEDDSEFPNVTMHFAGAPDPSQGEGMPISGNTISIDFSAQQINGKVIALFFDGNTVTSVKEMPLPQGENGMLDIPVPKSGATRAKIFIWDSVSGIQTLYEAPITSAQ